MLPAISDIIRELEWIIDRCIATNDRTGYFAVLYHRVTCRIQEGILKEEFENNARMERLDVIFALRYLHAWKAWAQKGQLTDSWRVAFESAQKGDVIVMQHLLMGINAHINLDLGIAAAETAGVSPLSNVQGDFDSINNILAELVDEVQRSIGKVSPLMFLADMVARSYDEMLVCFSINTARQGAWLFAREVYGKTGEEFAGCVRQRDARIAALGRMVADPKGKLFYFVLKLVRWFEWRSPADIISKLKFVVKASADKV